jgi:3'-phosphoadenosine 5'-phosphosulfate sulfotransferase (PAPS reductase)/FAD synthetase
MSRIVCQFSCGAASGVATKLTLTETDSTDVLIVNAFIEEEHPDNRRFLTDCERWFGQSVLILRNHKYNASTHEVWRRNRFMNGPHGAPCSRELKRKLLANISRPDDRNVLGFTVEEQDRFESLQDHFPDVIWEAPLIERNLTKADCLTIIERAGIEIPKMYQLGYSNANCIGCPKGGQHYWQAIREDFPSQFVEIQAIQESIGPGAYFLRFQSGPRNGERMSLADLPPGRGNMATEPNFSCSFFCDMALQDIAQ